MDYIKLNPQMILDIGSGLNIDSQLLSLRFPKSQIYSIDFAQKILKNHNTHIKPALTTNPIISAYIHLRNYFRQIFNLNPPQHDKIQHMVCANALYLPFKSQSMDLVWSNLTIPYMKNTTDLELFFKELCRVLKIGGTFLVTGLGVDSLKQLRNIGLRTHNFPDMHLIGDILLKCGFSNAVTDTEYLTIEYDSIHELLTDIRLIGCGNALIDLVQNQNKEDLPSDKTLSRAQHQALYRRDVDYKNSKDQGWINQQHKIPLTLEIFYAHGFKDTIQLELENNQKIIKFNHHSQNK